MGDIDNELPELAEINYIPKLIKNTKLKWVQTKSGRIPKFPTYWVTASGARLEIKNMSTEHILNAIRFLRRWSCRTNDGARKTYIEAFKRELRRRKDESYLKLLNYKTDEEKEQWNELTEQIKAKHPEIVNESKRLFENWLKSSPIYKQLKNLTDRERFWWMLTLAGINYTNEGDKICIAPEAVNGAEQEICVQFYDNGKFQEIIVYNNRKDK